MNKINTYAGFIALAGLLVFLVFNFSNRQKVVYVDTTVLMGKYQGMIDAKAEFQKKAATWQANMDTLIKNFQDELKAYEKERSTMTAKEKSLKEELLNNRQMQVNQYREAMAMKAREEEQKMTQTVLNGVNDFVKEYGKKKGYRYILGANGSGSLIYANEAYNITEDLLKGLNEEYSKVSGKK